MSTESLVLSELARACTVGLMSVSQNREFACCAVSFLLPPVCKLRLRIRINAYGKDRRAKESKGDVVPVSVLQREGSLRHGTGEHRRTSPAT